MESADELEVLRQLERGEISAGEAAARLNAPPVIERTDTPPFDRTQLPTWIQQIGIWTLFIGVLMIVLGTWIVAATVHANVLWLIVGLPIILLGSLVSAIGASTFSGHWLYINVENARNRRKSVRFGIPFPMGLLRLGFWFARFAPAHSTRLNVGTSKMNFNAVWENSDELFDAIERELREGRGITIDVDDKDERVQVYII